MWPQVLRAPRIGVVDARVALGAAIAVVGQRHVDLAGDRIDLDILRAIHLRRAQRVAGLTSADEHVGLRAEAVRRGQRSLAEDQREPRARCRRR